MRKLYRIVILMILGFTIYTVLNVNKVQAASATISGSRTVTQGESVTVTGTLTILYFYSIMAAVDMCC